MVASLPMEVNGNVAGDVLASGAAMRQMKTTYATAVAVQRPRTLPDVQRRFMEEARLAGEDFYYGWGAGKDMIEGASVKLAMSLARCWGNCAIEALPVQELGDSWVFTAAFVDLETGFTLTRQFRQSKKWTVYGKHDDQRKDDIRFQIGQSKAARNVILNSLPERLISKGIEEAKSGVREGIEKYIRENSLPAAVDKLLRAMAKAGVKEEAILNHFGVAKRDALDVDNLVAIRGHLHAIESGQERAESLYPPLDSNQRTEAVASKLDAVPTPPAKPKEEPKAEQPAEEQTPDEITPARADEIEIRNALSEAGADQGELKKVWELVTKLGETHGRLWESAMRGLVTQAGYKPDEAGKGKKATR